MAFKFSGQTITSCSTGDSRTDMQRGYSTNVEYDLRGVWGYMYIIPRSWRIFPILRP